MTPTTPTEPGAEAPSTAPEQQQDWYSRVQGLAPEEQELARGYLEKAYFNLKHGKTGQELALPVPELLNLAEQGFDAQSKTQAAAEAIRLQEYWQQNQAQIEAGLQLAQYLQGNPQLAQQFAAMVGQVDPQAAGFMPQTQAEAAMYQRLQQLEAAEAQRAQMGEQQQHEAQMQQTMGKLKADVQRIAEANPRLFDPATAGPAARLNVWKLQQEAEKLSAGGYYNENLLDFAFHNTFGKQLEKQTLSRYINQKQNNAPPVSSGGTPAGSGRQQLTKEQYFARGRARLMGTAYND
jgi:hypothetical protein